MLEPIAPAVARAVLEASGRTGSPLLKVLVMLDRMFSIEAPDAPSLKMTGAIVNLDDSAARAHGTRFLSASGTGLTTEDAMLSCLGEAVEAISQFERTGDVTVHPAAHCVTSGWIAQAMASATRPGDWVRAVNAASGGPAAIPADICLRREPARRCFTPVGALSAGVAAGATLDDAAERALLELIERDALALWWLGGRLPRAIAPGDPLTAPSQSLIRHLRAGIQSRVTTLLELTTDLAVPVIAACSHDSSGFALACGVAARGDRQSAAAAAIREMMQMEVAPYVARRKRAESGDHALNDADRRHIERHALHVPSCALFKVRRPLARTTAIGSTGNIVRHLGRLGAETFRVDLTRPDMGVPVVRAVAPDLQPFDRGVKTARLLREVAASGGGVVHHRGILPV
jgi:thiazole/oxazole-forming peptide maturase SagD family component